LRLPYATAFYKIKSLLPSFESRKQGPAQIHGVILRIGIYENS